MKKYLIYYGLLASLSISLEGMYEIRPFKKEDTKELLKFIIKNVDNFVWTKKKSVSYKEHIKSLFKHVTSESLLVATPTTRDMKGSIFALAAFYTRPLKEDCALKKLPIKSYGLEIVAHRLLCTKFRKLAWSKMDLKGATKIYEYFLQIPFPRPFILFQSIFNEGNLKGKGYIAIDWNPLKKEKDKIPKP